MKKDVGRRLREARERAGFKSAEAFAAHIKAHPNSVYKVERGKQWIGPEMLEKISGGLKESPAILFDDAIPMLVPTDKELLDILAARLLAKPAKEKSDEPDGEAQESYLARDLEAAHARIRELEAQLAAMKDTQDASDLADEILRDKPKPRNPK